MKLNHNIMKNCDKAVDIRIRYMRIHTPQICSSALQRCAYIFINFVCCCVFTFFLFQKFNFSTPLYTLFFLFAYGHYSFQRCKFCSVLHCFCLVGQQRNLMMLWCERTHSQKAVQFNAGKICLMAYVRLKRCENLHGRRVRVSERAHEIRWYADERMCMQAHIWKVNWINLIASSTICTCDTVHNNGLIRIIMTMIPKLFLN